MSTKAIKETVNEDIPDSGMVWLSTGCTILDLVVGGGIGMGFPTGRIVNFVGDKSSGKTFVSQELIAAAYHTYGKRLKWNYDDSETGCTFDSGALFGFNIAHKDTMTSTTVEEMDAHVGRFLKSLKGDQVGIYVVDSLDGLSDADKEGRSAERMKQSEDGKTVENKGTYGMGSAKFLSQDFFKTKTAELANKNALLFTISQVRENINAGIYGKKHTRSGGKALDFYCHTVVWLANLSKIIVNGKQVGVVVHAKTEKSKTPRPFRECSFSILFDYGIDNIGTNLDYLFDLRGERGELLKAAECIPWDAKKLRNLANVVEWLKECGAYTAAQKDKRAETGKANLSVAWLLEWIPTQPDLALTYEEHFGKSLDRAALITMIESDPEMEKELERRVIEKWEAGEAAVKSCRRPKYA